MSSISRFYRVTENSCTLRLTTNDVILVRPTLPVLPVPTQPTQSRTIRRRCDTSRCATRVASRHIVLCPLTVARKLISPTCQVSTLCSGRLVLFEGLRRLFARVGGRFGMRQRHTTNSARL